MRVLYKCILLSPLLISLFFRAHYLTTSETHTPFDGTPLEAAASAVLKQDTNELSNLAAKEPIVNQFGPKCQTLLSIAIAYKRLNSVNALLRLGANPNLSTRDCGARAMYIAALTNDLMYLRILLDHGGSPNARDGDGSPITETAAGSFRWDNFWLLIDRGADVNAFDRENFNKSAFTLVSSLASINQYEQVYKLAERGASLKLLPRSGITVASCIRYNNVDPNSDGYTWMQRVKQLMISRGIDLNVPRFGPPSPNQWLPNQPGKEELLKEYENAKAANAKYEREHPSS